METVFSLIRTQGGGEDDSDTTKRLVGCRDPHLWFDVLTIKGPRVCWCKICDKPRTSVRILFYYTIFSLILKSFLAQPTKQRCTWCVFETRSFTWANFSHNSFFIYVCSNWKNAYDKWVDLDRVAFDTFSLKSQEVITGKCFPVDNTDNLYFIHGLMVRQELSCVSWHM